MSPVKILIKSQKFIKNLDEMIILEYSFEVLPMLYLARLNVYRKFADFLNVTKSSPLVLPKRPPIRTKHCNSN